MTKSARSDGKDFYIPLTLNLQTRKGPELVADAGMKCVVMEQMEQWTEVTSSMIMIIMIVMIIVTIIINNHHDHPHCKLVHDDNQFTNELAVQSLPICCTNVPTWKRDSVQSNARAVESSGGKVIRS